MGDALKAQLLYLRQDLKFLDKIKCDVEGCSKVNASLLCSYVANFRFQLRSEIREYVFLLESILNVLHGILLKCCEALVMSADVNSAAHHNNVVRPKFVLFGKIINTLWHNAKETGENETKGYKVPGANEDKGIANSSSHKQTQTTETAPNRCDSCFIAEACVKKIMSFTEHGLNSSCNIQNMEVRQELPIDITQPGAMMRITNSLEDYVFSVLTEIRRAGEEVEIVKQVYNKLNEDLSNERQSNSVLLENNKRLEIRATEDESTVAFLGAERDGLRRAIAEYEAQTDILRTQLRDNTESIKIYEGLVSNCQNEIDQWKRIFGDEGGSLFTNYRRRIERLNANIAETDSNIADLIESLAYMVSSTDVLCARMDEIARTCQGIDSRVTDLIDKCSLSNYVKTLFNKCQDAVSAVQNRDADADADAPPAARAGLPPITRPARRDVQGNPLVDMTRQIEDNKKHILTLEAQNVKLEKVVRVINKHCQ